MNWEPYDVTWCPACQQQFGGQETLCPNCQMDLIRRFQSQQWLDDFQKWTSEWRNRTVEIRPVLMETMNQNAELTEYLITQMLIHGLPMICEQELMQIRTAIEDRIQREPTTNYRQLLQQVHSTKTDLREIHAQLQRMQPKDPFDVAFQEYGDAYRQYVEFIIAHYAKNNPDLTPNLLQTKQSLELRVTKQMAKLRRWYEDLGGLSTLKTRQAEVQANMRHLPLSAPTWPWIKAQAELDWLFFVIHGWGEFEFPTPDRAIPMQKVRSMQERIK